MSAAAGLLALAAIGACGTGLVEQAFATRPGSGSDRALRVVLGLGLGAGVWSLGFALALFAFGLSTPVVVAKDALLVVLGVGLAVRARRRQTRSERASSVGEAQGKLASPVGETPAPASRARSPASSILATAVAAAGLLAALLVVERYFAHPEGSWDAIAIWNNRARYLLLGEGRAFARAFSPGNAHPDYPLLVPACVAQGWRWLGERPLVGLGVGAGFLALAVASLGLIVTRRRGSDAGLGVALVLLGAPSFVALAATQIADVPLAAFVAIALGLVALALEEDERRGERLALAGLAAGLGAWTKNEGELFLVAIGLALAATRARPDEPRRESLRRAAIFVVGALPALVALAWLKLGYAPRNDILAGLGGALEKLGDLRRPIAVGRAALDESVRAHRWGVGVLASPILVIAFAGRNARGPAVRVAAIACALVAAGFLAVYVVTPLDLQWHLEHSLERLAAQLLPAWLLVVFLSFPGSRPVD